MPVISTTTSDRQWPQSVRPGNAPLTGSSLLETLVRPDLCSRGSGGTSKLHQAWTRLSLVVTVAGFTSHEFASSVISMHVVVTDDV